MSGEGGSSSAVVGEREKSKEKRTSFWSKFDGWIDEEPAVRRQKFEIIRSALSVHCEYTSIVIKKIDSKENAMQKFTAFVNLAHETKFMTVEVGLPCANIFQILIDLFSTIPEYRDETGAIKEHLRAHLSNFLDSDVHWNMMYCNPFLVRGVYWQLLFTLRLAPHGEENEDTGTLPADRPKLIFGCFILAVLVAFAFSNEHSFAEKIPNYFKRDSIEDFLLMLISSEHFRSLCQFFLIGLWLVNEYKTKGGKVTGNTEELTPEEIEEQKKALKIANVTVGGGGAQEDFEFDENGPSEIQREWEAFVVALKNKGALVFPEGYRIVGKGGRKPKLPIKKRKTDEAAPVVEEEEEAEEPQQQVQEPQEPQDHPAVKKGGRQPKKTPKSSPKKQVRPRSNNRNPDLPSPNQPSTSADIPSTSGASQLAQVLSSAEDTGLLPPIYFMHTRLLDIFSAECKRRKEEESSDPEVNRNRVEASVYEVLNEVNHVNSKMKNAPTRKPNQEQKAVMVQFRKQWRRGDEKEIVPPLVRAVMEEQNKVEDVRVVERVSTPRSARGGRKPAKKWKRQY